MTAAGTRARSRRTAADPTTEAWSGRYRDYDLVKEFVIALVVVSVLTVGLAALFSSPDVKQITISTWSRTSPNDFVATAVTELDGTSGSATYGAPYNDTANAAMKLGPISLQHMAGVTHRIHPADDFVVRPLSGVPGDAALAAALATWKAAPADTRTGWASAYDAALQAAPDNDPAKVASGDYGPVPVMVDALLRMAQSGGLDGALLSQGEFFQTDYTKPLLFIADGTYLEERAVAQHHGGDQWGMMNETGNYPGQAWLWLYTFWYQVKPFSTSGNGDVLVWALMALLTLGFVLVPFIPGVRSVPRWIPVHRLIWRSYYRGDS
jgi:hypothetical protein